MAEKKHTQSSLRRLNKAGVVKVATKLGLDVNPKVNRLGYVSAKKTKEMLVQEILDHQCNRPKQVEKVGQVKRRPIWTLAELKAAAEWWWHSDPMWKRRRTVDELAQLKVKVEREYEEALRYLRTTKTGTDDPQRPEIGRPWSGIFEGWAEQIEGEIRCLWSRGKRAAEFEAAYEKAKAEVA